MRGFNPCKWDFLFRCRKVKGFNQSLLSPLWTKPGGQLPTLLVHGVAAGNGSAKFNPKGGLKPPYCDSASLNLQGRKTSRNWFDAHSQASRLLEAGVVLTTTSAGHKQPCWTPVSGGITHSLWSNEKTQEHFIIFLSTEKNKITVEPTK